MTAKHTITLIPGDGIGPEVTEAVVRIVEASGVDISWERHDAGVKAVETHGTPLPDDLIESIRRNRVALKGPVGTPIGGGFSSVNVGLRKALDLYANLRPVSNLPHVRSRFDQREHRMSLDFRVPAVARAPARPASPGQFRALEWCTCCSQGFSADEFARFLRWSRGSNFAGLAARPLIEIASCPPELLVKRPSVLAGQHRRDSELHRHGLRLAAVSTRLAAIERS